MIRVVTLIIIFCLFTKPAYAYIDVALGSLILQSLIAGFFAFLVMWRNWAAKLKNFFRGNGFKLDSPAAPDTPAEE